MKPSVQDVRSVVFVDTSIQIARFFRDRETKRRIEEVLRQFQFRVSSLVVRQEFKRRVLKDAKYLLELCGRKRTVVGVRRYLNEVLPRPQDRKAGICLQLIDTFDEDPTFASESDDERLDRLKAFLESLLMTGLDEFDGSVDTVIVASNCGAGKGAVRLTGKLYDLGNDKCAKNVGCGIQRLIAGKRTELTALHEAVTNMEERIATDELRSAKEFVDRYLADPTALSSMDPCLKVGDLLIALESSGTETFYTMNYRESRVLAPALGQCLIVRPNNPDRDEISWSPGAAEPEFGA